MQAVKQIIDRVYEQATWDDIMYKLYVKQIIEKGLKAVFCLLRIPEDSSWAMRVN